MSQTKLSTCLGLDRFPKGDARTCARRRIRTLYIVSPGKVDADHIGPGFIMCGIICVFIGVFPRSFTCLFLFLPYTLSLSTLHTSCHSFVP